jgi:hypothetical protein
MPRIALAPLVFAWLAGGCFVAGSVDDVAGTSSTSDEVGTESSGMTGTSGDSTTDGSTETSAETGTDTSEEHPAGEVAWSFELGAIAPTGADANSLGKITLVGNLLEMTDLGLASGPLLLQGMSDLAFLGFGSDGALLWGARAGGDGAEFGTAYTVTPTDRVAVAAIYTGAPDFGTGPLPAAMGFRGVLLELVEADVVSSVPLIASTIQPRGIDVNGSGFAIATGEYEGTLDVAGTQIMSAGASDGYYLRLDTQGPSVANLVTLGGTGPDGGVVALFDGLGGIYLLGQFSESVALGPGNLVSAGGRDVYVVRAGTNGSVMWAKRLGGSGADGVWAAQVGPAGELVVAGNFENELDYDGSPIASSGGASDAFLLHIGATGELDWSVTMPGPGAAIPRQVVMAADGTINVGGEVIGAVDLGGGNVQGAGELDGFVARYASDGTFVWGWLASSVADDRVTSLGYDGEGRLLVGLTYNADLELEDGTVLTGAGAVRGALLSLW